MNEHILAAAVIEQAAEDWRKAISPTSPKKANFADEVGRKRTEINKLRRFFRSVNADLFSMGNAKVILAGLEEEYQKSKGRLQIEAYERGEIG